MGIIRNPDKDARSLCPSIIREITSLNRDSGLVSSAFFSYTVFKFRSTALEERLLTSHDKNRVFCLFFTMTPALRLFPSRLLSLFCRNFAVFYLPVLLVLLFGSGCQTSNYNNVDGVKYYGQAKYDSAIRSFQLARSVDPNDANADYNLGATYHKLGMIARDAGRQEEALQYLTLAEENYRTALGKDSEFAAAYRGLVVLWSDLGYVDKAFELLTNWERRSPGNPESKVELACLYHEYGQAAESQYLLQSALLVDSSNARALRALGYYGEQNGRADLALDYYRRAVASDPSLSDLPDHIAGLEQNGQTLLALPYGYTNGSQQGAGTSGQTLIATPYPGDNAKTATGSGTVSY